MQKSVSSVLVLFVAAALLSSCSLWRHSPASAKSVTPTLPTEKVDTPAVPVAPVKAPEPVCQPGLGAWTALGPLPCRVEGKEFDRDFLRPTGGEAEARLQAGKTYGVVVNGIPGHRTAAAISSPVGKLNFGPAFAGDHQVLYAFAEYQAAAAEPAYFLLGADDCVKVWVNGVPAYDFRGNRPLPKDGVVFTVPLVKGGNRIMVKLGKRTGGWNLALRVLTPSLDRGELEKRLRRQMIAQFQRMKVVPQGWHGYVFSPGETPHFDWENPLFAETVVGTCQWQTRWFNAQGEEVDKPNVPGRYAVYLESTAPSGMKIRRALTLCCVPPQWSAEMFDASAFPEVDARNIVIDGRALAENRNYAAMFAGRYLFEKLNGDEEGAALLAALHELKSGEPPVSLDFINSPLVRNLDFQLLVKRKVLNVEKRFPALSPIVPDPALNAPVLRAGDETQAGFDPGTAARLHEICQQWYVAGQEPFSTLVARRGVVIYHEAFGGDRARAVTINTPMWIASVSKLLTAMTFAQLVERKLVTIDDPVGRFLPDFPMTGPDAITFRHCFTHTSGLTGHGSFGGLANPWLDNVIANGRETFTPGKKHSYNGDGYNLAGMAMEVVTGKSMPRLMQENLFGPLDMTNTFGADLGGGFVSSSDDLAKVGQMLLNQGAYGHFRFFSPRIYRQLLPLPLNSFYPGVKEKWGIGLMDLSGSDTDAAGKPLLSPNTIGHFAASNTIFLVDFDHQLVIVQVRNRGDANYAKFRHQLMQEIAKSLR